MLFSCLRGKVNLLLSDSLSTRENNFDIIRFFAATLVMVTHACFLANGAGSYEPLAQLTHQNTFGGLAVNIFFVISGFLITMSFLRAKNIWQYLKARILRIFPALIFVVFFTVFVVGPVATSFSLHDYFTSQGTYRYLANITLYYTFFDLPGVFVGNIYPYAVNGSLWTLWYEFVMYLIIAGLGVMKLLNQKVVPILLFVLLLVLSFIDYSGSHWITNIQFIRLALYFCAGTCFYIYREKIVLSHLYAVVTSILLVVGTHYGYMDESFAVFGAYLIFYLSLGPVPKFSNFAKYGDFSYGIYITSFPIQQLVVMLFHNEITAVQNFAVAFPITLVCSFISWHLIEKNALKLKKYKLSDLFSRKKQLRGT